MKYLLAFVLFIGVVSAQRNSGCQPNDLLRCTTQLKKLSSSSAVPMGSTRKDLENTCPSLQNGLDCIKDFASKCLVEEQKKHFLDMYESSTDVINEICTPGAFQDEYLQYAPCLTDEKSNYDKCLADYESIMGSMKGENGFTVQSEDNKRKLCGSFRSYMRCTNSVIVKACKEDEAVKFTDNLMQRLASPVITTHCEDVGDYRASTSGSAIRFLSPVAFLLSLYCILY